MTRPETEKRYPRGMAQPAMTFKLCVGGDVPLHRFSIPAVTFDNLVQGILSRHEDFDRGAYRVVYSDCDGDEVTISADDDLVEAQRQLEGLRLSALKIKIIPIATEEPAGGCCGPGRFCGPGMVPQSRYPPPCEDLRLKNLGNWCQAPHAAPQFADYGIDSGASGPPDSPTNSLPPYTYAAEYLAALQFPLGGFGAGNVFLAGDGTLQGWTCVNVCRQETEPMHDMPATFFALSYAPSSAPTTPQSFLLATPQNYTKANVLAPVSPAAAVSASSVLRLQALPGIRGLSMVAKYPIAEVSYDIAGCPLEVSLEALTPMIPMDVKNSMLPSALFTFSVTNNGMEACTASLMQAQQNFVGWNGQGDCTTGDTPFWGGNLNTPLASPTLNGLVMTSNTLATSDPLFGSLVVAAAANPDASPLLIPFAADENALFTAFTQGKGVSPADAQPSTPSAQGTSWCGGVVQGLSLAPGETKTATFILAWHFPNRTLTDSVGKATWADLPSDLGNFYATLWGDATAVAQYTMTNAPGLCATTRTYRDALYNSTVPPPIIETAGGRVACMRSNTMFYSKAGVVLGCEGNNCCPLNCTHVYGYTTLIEKLFPQLAMDMRVSDFIREFDDSLCSGDGGVPMRYGEGGWAIDGALACIIKTFLVAKQADGLAGDTQFAFLKRVWPNVKKQMQSIIKHFDDGTGVIRCAQQETYDTAMQGANTFIGSYYVTALRSCAAMAKWLGDAAFEATCSSKVAPSVANYEKICWNASYGYYTADVDSHDCQYSYGPGCFVDQLCAVGLSSACGLGHVFDPTHEASARKQIVTNNVVHMPPFQDMQKHFFPGDTGITVCSYPHGKLGKGMQYDTLVSTGFVYPVLAGLILDGNVDDALVAVNHIRQRHDGRNRSPWNEPECNTLYSRAMGGWNLYDQFAGLHYDSSLNALTIDPRVDPAVGPSGRFSCLFTAAEGWGTVGYDGPVGLAAGTVSLNLLWGTLTLATLRLPSTATAVATALVDGAALKSGSVTIQRVPTTPRPVAPVPAATAQLTFNPPLAIKAGSVLTVEVVSQ